jgi:3-oxoadipate enol-lactonase
MYAEIDRGNAINFDYHPPESGGYTFVFCNALGLSTDFWRDNIAPELRKRGHGTLAFDYRGQGKSRFDSSATLEPDEMITDILIVTGFVKPERPIIAGFAIGGQFAARAVLAGIPVHGLVMSNSLRANGPHTEWMIELETRLLELGGRRLANDALSPSSCGTERLAELRPSHLQDEPYEPLPSDHPRVRLQRGLKKYDWDVPYEELPVPVLVMTGRHNRRSFDEVVASIVARIPRVRSLLFADAGISLHKEVPDQVVDAFCDFAKAI